MMARGTAADVAVIALVGERGREVRGFLEHDLGAEGLRAVGGRRLDLRQPAADAHARRVRRDDDRRVLPRPGAQRAADDGLAHALRDGAARGRPGGRRAADRQGLPAVGVRAAARRCSSAPATSAAAAASRRSTPCSSRATTRTSRSPTPSARSSTATSCCRASWPRAITTRRSTSCRASAGRCPTSPTVEHRMKAGQRARLDGDDPRQRGPDQRRRLRAGQQPAHRRGVRAARRDRRVPAPAGRRADVGRGCVGAARIDACSARLGRRQCCMASSASAPQVALDLRRKQDEDGAARARRRAAGARGRRARARAEEARDAARTAHARAAREEARERDIARCVWYRNWMTRQQQVIAARARRRSTTRRAGGTTAAERARGGAPARARARTAARPRAGRRSRAAERRQRAEGTRRARRAADTWHDARCRKES